MVAARSSRRRPRPSEDGILAAAEALFAERGFGAPSLRDLLAAARVSTTAFYGRFPDKEAVLVALIERLFADLAAAAAAALPQARSLEDGFARGVDVLVEVVGPRKGLVRLALTEAAAVPAARATLAGAYRGLATLLAARLAEAGIADAGVLGWALVGAVEVQVRRWAVLGDLDDDALPEALHATARALVPSARAARSPE